MKLSLVLCALTALSGCATIVRPPQTVAEGMANAGYIPLEPLNVTERYGRRCTDRHHVWEPLDRSLPDNTVRLASRQIGGSGSASFGPVAIGEEDSSYQVIVDYINSDVVTVPLVIEASRDGEPIERFSLFHLSELPRDALLSVRRATAADERNQVTIPVYVGIGIRLTANVDVLKGRVNLSSLGALTAAAERNDVAGNMVVQTLGVSGSQVRALLPLPSELNNTTIQNSILAIGSIKAVIGDDEDTWTQVRVTGFYNPFADADPRFINAIRSELESSPIEWARPCTAAPTAAAAPRRR